MADEYIGSYISLLSKFDIRYEGVLCHISPKESTIALSNVKSYGTEGRKKDGPQIPPGDRVYEYILFRGSDIKDLQVKSSPLTQKEEELPNDPAIMQSQSSAAPLNSFKSDTVEGGYSASFDTNQEPATSANGYFPSTSPLYRPGITVEPGSNSMVVQSANLASSATPSYTQELGGIYPGTVQNHLQPTVIPNSSSTSLPYNSGVVDNVSSVSFPNSIPYSSTPAFGTEQYPIPSDILSSLCANIPVSPYYSSYQDMSANGALAAGKSAFDSVADGSVYSSLTLLSSVADLSFVNAPLSKLQSNLPTLDQLQHPRQPLAPSMPFTRPDEKNVSAFSPVSLDLSSSVPPTLHQQQFLPPQQPRHSLPDYTEEFDFEAMNEKFKKEEMWGCLGRAKQRVEGKESMESAIHQNFNLGGGFVSNPEPEPKPAYKKDDFFDTLSGNVHSRAPRNGQNMFPGRMKHNTEVFGDFGQTRYPGRGFYHHARGRDWNYRM